LASYGDLAATEARQGTGGRNKVSRIYSCRLDCLIRLEVFAAPVLYQTAVRRRLLYTCHEHAQFAARTREVVDGATPLINSQKPSGTSNAAIGIHRNDAIDPETNPASCKGRPTTRRAEATTPSQASKTGIIRPRSRRYEKSRLPIAKKIALMVEFGPLRK